MKCGKCGAELNDGAKFCSACGSAVERQTIVCPSCGFELNENARFCSNCGAQLEVKQFVVCPSCDKRADVGARFCEGCGTALSDVERVKSVELVDKSKSPASSSAPEKKSKPAGASVIKGLRDKTVGAEARTHVLRNAFVAFLAVLTALLVLLIPGRVVSYNFENMNITVGEDEISKLMSFEIDDLEDGAELEIKCETVAVKQSMIKLFGAFSYVGLDRENDAKDKKKYDAIVDKYEVAVSEAQSEAFDKYAVRVPGSTVSTVPRSKLDDYYRALEKAYAKHLSEINYIGYLLATENYTVVRAGVYNGKLEYELISGEPGAYVSDLVTLITYVVVTAIAIGIAAICAAWLVFAVIGLVKKRSGLSPERLIFITSLLAGVGLIASMIAPCGKASGAMIAVLAVAIAASAVLGVCHVATGKTSLWAFVKRAGIAALSVTALLLLTTDAVTLGASASITASTGVGIVGGKSISIAVNMRVKSPVSAFAAQALEYIVPAAEGIASEIEIDLTGVVVSSLIALVMTVALLVFAFVAMMSTLRALRAGESETCARKIPHVAAAAVALLLIIFTGGVSPALCRAFSEFATVDGVKLEVEEWFAMRAQTYFAMFIEIGAFVALLLLFHKTKRVETVKEGEQAGEIEKNSAEEIKEDAAVAKERNEAETVAEEYAEDELVDGEYVDEENISDEI